MKEDVTLEVRNASPFALLRFRVPLQIHFLFLNVPYRYQIGGGEGVVKGKVTVHSKKMIHVRKTITFSCQRGSDM